MFVNDTICWLLDDFDCLKVLWTVFETRFPRLEDADFAPLVKKQRNGAKPGEKYEHDQNDLCRLDVWRGRAGFRGV